MKFSSLIKKKLPAIIKSTGNSLFLIKLAKEKY